jgi:hypothetical protein
MWHEQTVRSRLPANREGRRCHRRDVQRSAFGVYRPLEAESQAELKEAMSDAEERVKQYFGKSNSKYTKLVIPKSHGVTYLERGEVRGAMQSGGLRNFDVPGIKKGVANYNYKDQEDIRLPIDDFEWYGIGHMKLAAKFAIEELVVDTGALGQILHRAGGAELPVRDPNHVTLCKFPRSRNPDHLVNENQKYDVAMIVHETLQQAEVTSLKLGELVLGHGGYNAPIEIAA